MRKKKVKELKILTFIGVLGYAWIYYRENKTSNEAKVNNRLNNKLNNKINNKLNNIGAKTVSMGVRG